MIEEVLKDHSPVWTDVGMYGHPCTCGWGRDYRYSEDELREHIASEIRYVLSEEILEAVWDGQDGPLGTVDVYSWSQGVNDGVAFAAKVVNQRVGY